MVDRAKTCSNLIVLFLRGRYTSGCTTAPAKRTTKVRSTPALPFSGRAILSQRYNGNRVCGGGMAEWSMAVVLKTSRIGYDIAVIFCRVVPRPDLQYLAIIAAF